MRVKKLEWVSSGINRYESKNINLYSIHLLDNRYVKNKFEPRYGKAVFNLCDDLEEAKKLCQDHFERLVLSQIEPDPVKEFDPTLIGFELQKESKGITYISRYYLIQIGNRFLRLHYILEDDKCDKYTLVELDSTKYYTGVTFFEKVKIPDHDFGVKLISQFLEVE